MLPEAPTPLGAPPPSPPIGVATPLFCPHGHHSLTLNSPILPPQVLLTLCNDQFSRWHVEAAARDAFFFLCESAPFSPGAFPGYQPRRGHSDDSFPLDRALTFRFIFHPPSLLLGPV